MPSTLKVLLGSALCCLPLLVNAAEQPAKPATDQEASVDEGLKKFGYLSGLALGCVDDKQTEKLEREVMDVNAELTRLLGSDSAFLYSAAFGYGSNIELKAQECKEVLERYEARYQSFLKGAKS